jgi:hypothetical protein
LKTAETMAGTIPSSMNEGMKHMIIGSTLRTANSATSHQERSTTCLASRSCMVL